MEQMYINHVLLDFLLQQFLQLVLDVIIAKIQVVVKMLRLVLAE